MIWTNIKSFVKRMWCKISSLKNMQFKNLGPKRCLTEKIIIYVHVLLSNIMIMLMVKCKHYEHETDIMWWRVIKKSKCWLECGKLKTPFLIKNLNQYWLHYYCLQTFNSFLTGIKQFCFLTIKCITEGKYYALKHAWLFYWYILYNKCNH